MHSKYIAGLTVTIFAGFVGAFSIQDQHQQKSKEAQTKKEEVAKQDLKPTQDPTSPQVDVQKLQSQLEQFQNANQKVVKRLMRVVHREPDSPLVVFSDLIKQDQPKLDWSVLEAKAKLVEAMAFSLQTPGSKSKATNYLKMATQLRESTKAKDYPALKENVRLFQNSCGSCHGWAPPG